MYATLLLLMILPASVIQTEAEEAYRQQYQEYTQISELTDPAEQADRYLAFLEKGFDEQLLGAVLQGLQGDLQALTQAQNYDEVYRLADAWFDMRNELAPVALALEAAMASGDARQIVGYGERFYESQAVPQVALVLAQSFSEIGNAGKVREYGLIAIDNFPIEQTWSLAYELVGQYQAAEEWSDASAMASRIKDGLSSAPEGVSASEWNDIQLYLQSTIAGAAYESGQWQRAVDEYNRVLAMDPRSDEAYYFVGQSELKLERIANSMNSFAKSYVLDGSYSQAAYDMLRTIYGANTGGNLQGMDNVIGDARRELN
jgi:tetratricopeptide (TPR) repeat protein